MRYSNKYSNNNSDLILLKENHKNVNSNFKDIEKNKESNLDIYKILDSSRSYNNLIENIFSERLKNNDSNLVNRKINKKDIFNHSQNHSEAYKKDINPNLLLFTFTDNKNNMDSEVSGYCIRDKDFSRKEIFDLYKNNLHKKIEDHLVSLRYFNTPKNNFPNITNRSYSEEKKNSYSFDKISINKINRISDER